jgi:hypothetical protein
MVAGREGALQVHFDDRVPLLFRHGEHHPVPQDPGVVHDDVEATEVVDGLAHQLLGSRPVADVVGVGHCLTAEGRDLVDHLLRGTGVVPGSFT